MLGDDLFVVFPVFILWEMMEMLSLFFGISFVFLGCFLACKEKDQLVKSGGRQLPHVLEAHVLSRMPPL